MIKELSIELEEHSVQVEVTYYESLENYGCSEFSQQYLEKTVEKYEILNVIPLRDDSPKFTFDEAMDNEINHKISECL